MNREEASFILANIDRRVCDDELNEALDMAIKTLDREPCEMTAEEYRQRMIQAFHNADTDELIAICVLPAEKEFEHLEWLLKNHYKKEPCCDAIDRSKAIMIASGYCHPANVAKELAKLPPVNPKLCEDAISRQAVRHILNHEVKMPIKVWKKVFELVDDLPSVTPQPKIGHWINIGSEGEIDGQIVQSFSCSECGAISIFRIGYKRPINSDLCPNCGCRMVEPQEI